MTTNSNSNNIDEYIPMHFKVAHTGQRSTINIPGYICISNFIEYIKNNVYEIFQISRNQEIEIVEGGQGTAELRDEDAPAIVNDFDTTVREKYGNIYNNLTFYIRIVYNM